MRLWPKRLSPEKLGQLLDRKPGFLKKLRHQERLRGGAARCLLCERRCVIGEGAAGACGTVYNVGGELYSVAYGLLSALESRPAEIKPFHHYAAGSSLTTASTWGCNFPCPWCQNWHLSKRISLEGRFISPEELAALPETLGDVGVNFSFNEPTMLLEYAADVGRAGARVSFNTNGYMTEEALNTLISSGLDAANVDIKGDDAVYRRVLGARPEAVWRNVKIMVEAGVHVELTALIIPGVNDEPSWAEKLAERIVEELGQDTPLHISRFYPAYAMKNTKPTPVKVLEEFRRKAVEAGLRYVYIGNVPGSRYEHTYCPRCGKPVILRRGGIMIAHYLTADGRCKWCGYKISLRLWPPKGYSPSLYVGLI